MKKVIYIILINLLILTSTLLSQIIPKVSISGKISDASNNKPIENVDVFLSFTTRGDITDKDGIYTINNIQVGKYILVISLIGYEVIKEEIELTKSSKNKFNFRLKSRAIKAPELEVRAARANEWLKNYKKFKRTFLGSSANAAKSNILNPEYIDLDYSENSNKLKAYSSQPIQVENNALGYKISFNLLDFLSDGYFDTKFMVTARFHPNSPKDEKEAKKWKKARTKAYKGSMRHFFASLAAGTLGKEKFEVYQTSNIYREQTGTYYQKLNIDESVIMGQTEYERKLSFDKYLKIIYNGEYEPVEYARVSRAVKSHQVSWIELIGDSVTFNTNGVLYEPYAVLAHGLWAWERAAEMLPLDYKPDLE
jgi:hypothetical protein